jgi:hypothetical protein
LQLSNKKKKKKKKKRKEKKEYLNLAMLPQQ